MSAQTPPTQILPIFNTNEFASSSDGMTIDDADKRYLQLDGGIEYGTVVFNSGLTSAGDVSITNGCALLANSIQASYYSDINIGTIESAKINLGKNGVNINSGKISATSFVKAGGLPSQYLMADGNTTTTSAQGGSANIYLYQNIQTTGGVLIPFSGSIRYDNPIQASATTVFISSITADGISIDPFLTLITSNSIIYIQDRTNSFNFISYNVNTQPTPITSSNITIAVSYLSGSGTGLTTFGDNSNIFMSVFTNQSEVDTRISIAENSITTIETKTQNQTAVPGTTTFTGQINVGTSQTPNDIFNNGSSLTKNNFNTSQSVGCIGFKDNWATATGNNANIKQGMIYMSNVGRVIVISNLTPQYFDDISGALINCIGGLTGLSQQYVYIPSLGLAYGRNLTQYVTSTDGINWTAPANILGDIGVHNEPKIIYENGLYITNAGTGSIIQTSTDGITWTNRVSTRFVYTLIYTGTKFITFGANGCMYSTDGITWVNDTVQTNNIRSAIYCDTLGCILAQIQGLNRNIIRSYNSGLTWTTLTNVFPFNTASNMFIFDSVSGKAYNIADEPNNTYIYNSYLFEFDATGNPALGGSIKMMGNTSTSISSGLEYYIYNPSIKRFLFSRNVTSYKVYYSTTSNNLAVSGNQYIIGSLNCSGGYNPYGLANIDIMLRDSPFIGIQFINGSAYTATLNSPLLNSPWTAFGSTSSTGSVFSLTNNYTRQLCCADWSFPTPANGQLCGFGSSATTGVRVSTGFNFGISAVLGYADTGYSTGLQNFFGLYNLSTAPALSSTVPVTSLLSCILFGSSTTDANICIYTADAITMVKQVDLGASFPSNRPLGAVSTDWFKLTLYWDTSKFYYKAHNTTTNVIVSGSFSSAVIPATSIQLYPQCLRAMGASQTSNSCKLKVQRFGVYY